MRAIVRAETLLALVWVLVLVSLALPSDLLRNALALLLLAYLAASWRRIRWQVWGLCLGLGTTAVALAAVYDVWGALLDGLKRALIVGAFLPTVILLRATAEHRPEIATARQLFQAQDKRTQGRSVLVGAHFIGAVLIVGIFALLAPITGQDAPEAERRRITGIALRGMCLAVLWSPFFFGMGLANEYLPHVELIQVMPMGLVFAALGLLVSHLLFDRSGGISGLWQALASFAPVLPPVAIAAALVLILTAATTLSTLQALIVGMPVLCLLVLGVMGRKSLIQAAARTWNGLGVLGNELAIVCCAMMLGTAVQVVIGTGALAGATDWLRVAPPALIALCVLIITVGGLIGLHPIVTVAILLALLGGIETGVSDLVLMQTMLFGWAFSTMISVSAVSIATASALTGIAPERLVRGENLIFVVVFGTLSVLILSAVNYVLAR